MSPLTLLVLAVYGLGTTLVIFVGLMKMTADKENEMEDIMIEIWCLWVWVVWFWPIWLPLYMAVKKMREMAQ